MEKTTQLNQISYDSAFALPDLTTSSLLQALYGKSTIISQ